MMPVASSTDLPRLGPRDACARRGRRLPGLAWLLSGIGIASAQPPAFYAFEIFPDLPRAQQAVYAVVDVPYCYTIGEVAHVQGVIQIGVRPTGCFPRPGTRPLSDTLGKLPQGEYRVHVVNAVDEDRPGLSPERVLTVAPPVPGDYADEFEPLLDFSGWWTTADADRGEGWLVEHKAPDRMMFSWVAYDADGNPDWLVMQSTQRDHYFLSGPVYRSRREGGAIVRTLVGQGYFWSTAPDTATFRLVPDDSSQSQSVTELRRLLF